MNDLLASWRAAALTEPCEYCSATPTVPCTDPRTGYELTHQAAHLCRLRRVGFGQLGVIYPDPTLDLSDEKETDHDYYRR